MFEFIQLHVADDPFAAVGIGKRHETRRNIFFHLEAIFFQDFLDGLMMHNFRLPCTQWPLLGLFARRLNKFSENFVV